MLAVVLSRRDWQEYDQLISLYTLEKGRLEVIAKGVKKITSKNSACLEPGFLIEAEIITGREIDRLVKAHLRESFKNCWGDLTKLSLAGYVIRLFDKNIYPEKKDDNLFNLLVNFLYFCDDATSLNPAVVLAFMLKFIYYLGFQPEFNSCTSCGCSLRQNNFYFFSYAAGGLVCPDKTCRVDFTREGVRLSGRELRILKIMLTQDWKRINQLTKDVVLPLNVKRSVYGFFGYCLSKRVAYLA